MIGLIMDFILTENKNKKGQVAMMKKFQNPKPAMINSCDDNTSTSVLQKS